MNVKYRCVLCNCSVIAIPVFRELEGAIEMGDKREEVSWDRDARGGAWIGESVCGKEGKLLL